MSETGKLEKMSTQTPKENVTNQQLYWCKSIHEEYDSFPIIKSKFNSK